VAPATETVVAWTAPEEAETEGTPAAEEAETEGTLAAEAEELGELGHPVTMAGFWGTYGAQIPWKNDAAVEISAASAP